MSNWLFIPGIFLVVLVFVDALWTTLWSEGGAGPMTDRLSALVWRLAKGVATRGGELNHRALTLAGPATVVVTVASWLLLLWTGITLMFLTSPEAVVNATTFEPGDLSDRIWFVLYTAATVGNGDYLPNTSFYQVLAGFSANAAIATLTLAITYMIQVLSAVVQKRTFASEAFSLGESAADITDALQKSHIAGISSQLASLGTRLSEVTEQHKAYPILHYFHPSSPARSAARAVACVDEALMVYLAGLESDEAQLSASTLRPMRRSIDSFLDNYFDRAVRIQAREESPPTPDSEQLERRGVSVVRPEQLEEHARERDERRRLLWGLLDYNGWSWDEMLYGIP